MTDRLHAYRAGELAPDAERQVRLHLEECSSCAAFDRWFGENVAASIGRPGPEVRLEPEFARRVVDVVAGRDPDRRGRSARRARIVAVAAALVATAVLLGRLLMPESGGPRLVSGTLLVRVQPGAWELLDDAGRAVDGRTLDGRTAVVAAGMPADLVLADATRLACEGPARVRDRGSSIRLDAGSFSIARDEGASGGDPSTAIELPGARLRVASGLVCVTVPDALGRFEGAPAVVSVVRGGAEIDARDGVHRLGPGEVAILETSPETGRLVRVEPTLARPRGERVEPAIPEPDPRETGDWGLVDSVSHPDPGVRVSAVRTLALLDSRRGGAALVDRLRDEAETPAVRLAATESLAALCLEGVAVDVSPELWLDSVRLDSAFDHDASVALRAAGLARVLFPDDPDVLAAVRGWSDRAAVDGDVPTDPSPESAEAVFRDVLDLELRIAMSTGSPSRSIGPDLVDECVRFEREALRVVLWTYDRVSGEEGVSRLFDLLADDAWDRFPEVRASAALALSHRVIDETSRTDLLELCEEGLDRAVARRDDRAQALWISAIGWNLRHSRRLADDFDPSRLLDRLAASDTTAPAVRLTAIRALVARAEHGAVFDALTREALRDAADRDPDAGVRVEALARLGASPQVRPGEVERALLVATEILEDLAASGDSDAELCKAAVNVASLFAKLDPQSGPTLVRVGEALITLASDPSRDDEVRRSALNAFPRLQLPDERVLDALENLLETDGRFGSIERDALIGMQLRIHAEGDTAHRRLVELSRDPDEALRFAAATELMNWEWNRKDAPRALERLAAWSAHPDPAVRSESIRKIENLRGLDEHPAALRRRIEHVRTQFENATSPDVRIAAGMALIRLDGAGGRNAGVLPEMISTVPDPTIRRRTRERFADFLADVDESRRADPERIRPVIDAWIEDYLDDVEIVHDALRVAIARRIVPSASSLRAAGRSTSWWIRAAAAGLDAVAGRWNEPTRTRLREALAEGPADLTRFVAEDLPFASEAGPVAAPALEDVWRLLQEIDRHSMFLVMPEGTTLTDSVDRYRSFVERRLRYRELLNRAARSNRVETRERVAGSLPDLPPDLAAPLAIGLVCDADVGVRRLASGWLEANAPRVPAFDAEADPDPSDEALATWRRWWADVESRPEADAIRGMAADIRRLTR